MNADPSKSYLFGASPFLWAFKFDASGIAEACPDPALCEIPSSGAGFIWVHLNLSDARSKSWIRNLDALPGAAREMFLSDDEHVRLHGGGSTIWGVFSDFGQEPGMVADSLATIRFAIADGCIITARRRAVECAETARAELATGRLHVHPIDVLETLVIAIIAALEARAEKTIAGINYIEDHVVGKPDSNDRRTLGPLRRETVFLHRQTTNLQRVLARFDDPTRIGEVAHAALRRMLQRLESIHHELHSTLERARLLHEEVASRLTEETNRQLYILTVISTLLLPPTFITGVFGMNTKGLLFTDNEDAFVYAMLMCMAAALAAYAVLFILGRAGANGK